MTALCVDCVVTEWEENYFDADEHDDDDDFFDYALIIQRELRGHSSRLVICRLNKRYWRLVSAGGGGRGEAALCSWRS